MSRSLRALAPAVAVLVGAGCLAPAFHASDERLSYEAAIVVRWGKPAGSDAFRRDLERALAESMSESCFARVVRPEGEPARSGADLLVDVVLTNVEDETIFDQSLANALDPDDPDRGMRKTARFSVDVAAKLVALASGDAILDRKSHAAGSRRPLVPGEDIQAYARAEAIDTIVRDLRRSLCSDKADRKIREALAPPATERKR